MDNEQPTMDNDQEFEPMPPENDESAVATDSEDDSDAPIKLDDLGPEMAEESVAEGDFEGQAESVAVGPGTETVRAENVTVSQGSAQSIEASNVSITQGAAANVMADELSVEQGGVALARTQQLTVKAESSAFAVYADSATVEEGANVFLLISPSVSGEVRPVLDWRAALAIGGGFAVALSILRRLR